MKIYELNLKLKKHLKRIKETDNLDQLLDQRIKENGWDTLSLDELDKKIKEIQDGEWYPQYTRDITALEHQKAKINGQLQEDTAVDDIKAEIARLEKQIEDDPENQELKDQKYELETKLSLTSHDEGTKLQESFKCKKVITEISDELVNKVSDIREQQLADAMEKEQELFDVYVKAREFGVVSAVQQKDEWLQANLELQQIFDKSYKHAILKGKRNNRLNK